MGHGRWWIAFTCTGLGAAAGGAASQQHPYAATAARDRTKHAAEVTRLRAKVAQQEGEIASLQQQLARARLGRMEPTRVSLDGREIPAGRQPIFAELYEALYGRPWDAQADLWAQLPTPWAKEPNFTYAHSPFWEEGRVAGFLAEAARLLGSEGGDWAPRFVVEVGTFFGMSAIRWAQELDRRNLTDVPVLCVDPFVGDLNMWLNKAKAVWQLLDVRRGRPTLYEQFAANVGWMVAAGEVAATHILPFPVTGVIAARWLHLQGFRPDAVFLDSAHEVDETYMELALFLDLLADGGVLFGDDYQWPAVRFDVDRFTKYHNLRLYKDQQERMWAIVKPPKGGRP